MKITKEQIEDRIEFLERRIFNNKFTNDMAWKERGEQRIKDEQLITDIKKLKDNIDIIKEDGKTFGLCSADFERISSLADKLKPLLTN